MASQEKVYSSLYDLIFSQKKKGKFEPSDYNVPVLSGVGQALTEIAVNPLVYPVEAITGDLAFQANLASETTYFDSGDGLKIQVGVGSAANFINNPRKFIDKAFSKYEEGKKSARIGSLMKGVDGAIFYLQARKAGFSHASALGIGNAIGTSQWDYTMRGAPRKRGRWKGEYDYKNKNKDKEKGVGGSGSSGLERPTHYGFASSQARGIGSNVRRVVNEYEKKYGKLSPSDRKKMEQGLIKKIRNIGKSGDKVSRNRDLDSFVKGWGINNTLALDVANDVFGDRANNRDFGFVVPGLDAKASEKIKQRAIDSLTKEIDHRIANETDIAIKRNLQGIRRKFFNQANGVDMRGLSYLGSRIGNLMYMRSWFKDHISGGQLLAGIATGGLLDYKSTAHKSGYFNAFGSTAGWNKFDAGSNPDGLVFQYFDGRIKPGFRGGSPSKGDLNLMGRVSEAYYYWHPMNIVKGAVWDGRLYYRLWKNGKLKITEDRLKKLTGLMPSQVLGKFYGKKVSNFFKTGAGSKLLAKLGLKNISTLPLREILRKVMTEVIKKIFKLTAVTLTGPWGLVLDAAMMLAETVIMKIAKPLIQLLTLAFFGMIAFFILIGTGLFSTHGRTTKAQRNLNAPITQQQSALGVYIVGNPSNQQINCNMYLPDQVVPGVFSAQVIGDIADRWTSGQGTNYAEECYNDVICRAKSAGVDPAFALAMWLHESAASNYDFAGEVEDFGIHFTTPNDFNAQINSFTSLSFANACPGLDYETGWATKYLTGTCDTTRVVNGITGPDYLDAIKEVYSWVSSNPFPTLIKDSSRATGQSCLSTGRYTGYGTPTWDGYIPADYDATCPMPQKSVRCTQGPDGNVSQYHRSNLAVDFGYDGNAKIVAPADGTIQAANGSNSCPADGKDFGGKVILKDKWGYTWVFLHLESSVSAGQKVSKGDTIGYLELNLQTSDCWSGAHLHTHIIDPSGGAVNGEGFMNSSQVGCKFSCN